MLLTRIFQMTGNRALTLTSTRCYAKATTSTTTTGASVPSLGKSMGKLKSGLKPGAPAGAGKAIPVALEKRVLSVETDPHKLVSHLCGSNIMKIGEDVQLKSDEEYPEWLWTLRTGPPPSIEDLVPDSDEYWKRVRRLAHRRNNSLRHLKKYPRVT